MAETKLRVRSGQVVALRLFDLAYEINLKRAEELWAQRTQGTSARGRLVGTPPKAVSFGVPPLALELGPVAIEVAGIAMTATATVRLYDFGVAALALRLPVQDLDWPDFARWVNATDRAIGPTATTDVWETLLAQLRRLLSEALDRPTASRPHEDYLLAVVDGLDPPLAADTLLEQVDLVPLLSGEDLPLSKGAQHDLLRQRFSYHPDDLVVLTWDRAFILEPRGETDVADVLEIANAQLLEMRSYDEMLDEELPRMRTLVETARQHTNLLAARRYARLARRLHTLVGEVSVLSERVDNALQVTEDVYLARVYAAAMDLFRVPNVSAAVDRKLAIIRETYTALHDEAAGARAAFLETAILALIAVEIALSLLRH
jgi:hypothetical protein